LAKYLDSIKEEEGDWFKDTLRTIGFTMFSVGMVAPAFYYNTVGRVATTAARVTAPYLAAGLLGVGLGIAATTAIVSKLEEHGIVSEGATLDYLEQHEDFTTAWDNIYSPEAIGENITTIWEHYF